MHLSGLLPVLARLVPLVLCVAWVGAVWAEPQSGMENQAVRIPGLADLHAKAAEARDSGDHATVERLRLERLQLVQKAAGKSVWKDGVRAIAAADALCRRMKYRNAAEVLKKAWKPFSDSSGRDSAVLGDIALKIFEVQQAAIAVFPPDHPEFPAVSLDEIRAALQRAGALDPCQIEVRAAQAFLTKPNADESFQPAELQPSLVARNRDLLGISYAKEGEGLILPWHAAVEFLKAKSSSFVLDDLEYLETFLDPGFRIQGTDRLGEPFCVVLSGGLLMNGVDPQTGRSRRYVFDYVAGDKQWRRFRPLMLVVVPEDVKVEAWSLDEASVCAKLDAGFTRVLDLVTDAAERELVTVVGRFPDDVARAVRAIRDGSWRDDVTQASGPAAAAPFAEHLAFIQKQFDVYGDNFPKQRQAATAAMKELAPLMGALKDVARLRDAIRELFVKEYAADGSPAPPRMLLMAGISQEKLPVTLQAITAARECIGELDAPMLDVVVSPETEKGKKPQPPRPARDGPRRGPAGVAAKPETPTRSPKRLGDGPSGARLRLELLALLDDLRFLVHTRALADQNVVSAIDAFFADKSRAISGDEDAAAGIGVHAVLAEVDRAKRQIQETLRQSQAGDVLPGQTQTPLRLTAGQMNAMVSAAAVVITGRDFLGGTSRGDVDERLRQFVIEGRRIKEWLDVVELLTSWSQRADVVRTWKVAGCSWTFYEVPESMPLQDLASMIDGTASLAITDGGFARLGDDLEHGGVGGGGSVPLIPAATRMGGNPLADTRGDEAILRLDPPRALLPIFAIALVAEEAKTGGERPQPACDVDQRGRHTLSVEDRGRKLPLVLDTMSTSPTMSLEYPGVDGLQGLGVQANSISASLQRVLRDRRSNLIGRMPTGSVGPFEIQTQKGVRLTDRSVNYAWQDWRDLDRNIINTFMPNSLFLGPSLPVWMAYRRELVRPSPIPGFLWGVPRSAYR